MSDYLSRREQITDIVRRGMEEIPGYERQKGHATRTGEEICDEFFSGGSNPDHCCECFKRQDDWEQKNDLATIAVTILSEANMSTILRDKAEEYLMSFFCINSALSMPKFS